MRRDAQVAERSGRAEEPSVKAIANDPDTRCNRADSRASSVPSFLTPFRGAPRGQSGSSRFSLESSPMREMPRMRAAALRFPLV